MQATGIASGTQEGRYCWAQPGEAKGCAAATELCSTPGQLRTRRLRTRAAAAPRHTTLQSPLQKQ